MDDGIDIDFIGVDKEFMYAPRAQNSTKNVIVQSTISKKQLDTRKHFERFDKGNHKIIEKLKKTQRIGNKRKINAGFVTFKE